MLSKRRRQACLALAMASLLLPVSLVLGLVAPAAAQSGGDYDLTWSTVDGGGETFSVGGDYSLGGTAGQPDAGLLDGGDYALAGGFWGGGLPVQYRVYLPLLWRGSR
jgi:uncharacterized membrane protein